ncbi:hypothetical protein, partial [Escherichia coli]|uniref:hypothetical protein n=1 Tax=Escherichia coli TaxID=562 RepID=UPI001BDC6BEF
AQIEKAIIILIINQRRTIVTLDNRRPLIAKNKISNDIAYNVKGKKIINIYPQLYTIISFHKNSS